MTIHKKAPALRRLIAALPLFALPALVQTVPPAPAPSAPPPSATWYVVTIAGQPVGALHEEVADDGASVQVTAKSHLVLNRMGSKVEMQMGEVSREARDGRLQALDVDIRVSTQATSSHVTVEDGVVRIRDQAGERSFERTVPFTGDLLGPEGMRRLSAARLAKAGDRIAAQTWAAELGGVRTVTRTVAAEESVTVAGSPVRTLRVEEVTEGSPAKRLLWLDADGRIVQSSDPGPFGDMRTLRTNEAAARQAEAGGELPAEVYGSSLVHTQVRIPHPRRVERLVLRLRHRDPSLGWPDFAGPGQRVVEKTGDTVTLEITRPQPRTGQPFPVKAEGDDRAYLAPSAYVQSDDPEIRAAAQAVVAGETDAYQAGQKLQRWVTKNMKFDLGIVFAPSTEIFKNRRGTCAGYAMLLTTMARSVGIPARYVLGFVYMDGIFGGHAWVEIKVGEDWIPLDAAIPAVPIDTPADAGHIALLRTSLAEGIAAVGASPALQQMYGHLDIDVLSVTVAGKPAWTVPAGSLSYTIEEDLYRNTGLGIEIKKPSNFRFVGLDAVWPDDRLVGMEGPDWKKVDLRRATVYPGEDAETVAWRALDAQVPGGRHGQPSALRADAAGRPAWFSAREENAALAWRDGEDLWVLSVEGKDAGLLLRRIAPSVKLPD